MFFFLFSLLDLMWLHIHCSVCEQIVLEFDDFTNKTTLQIWHGDKRKQQQQQLQQSKTKFIKKSPFAFTDSKGNFYTNKEMNKYPYRRVTDKFSLYCPCQWNTLTHTHTHAHTHSIIKTKQWWKSVEFPLRPKKCSDLCFIYIRSSLLYMSVNTIEWIWIVNDD